MAQNEVYNINNYTNNATALLLTNMTYYQAAILFLMRLKKKMIHLIPWIPPPHHLPLILYIYHRMTQNPERTGSPRLEPMYYLKT